MVKINKSELPPEISIKSADDYRTGPVFERLVRDCHNKCYICEEKEITSINVEHIRAHKGDAELQFDWGNLLLSCVHCNKAKNKYFPDIIDCTRRDPELAIRLKIEPFPKSTVEVRRIVDDKEAIDTEALLNRIYNGESTSMLSTEGDNLRQRLQKEMLRFQALLWQFDKLDSEDKKEKQELAKEIQREIRRSSAFAAFKRDTIRRLPFFMELFGSYLA